MNTLSRTDTDRIARMDATAQAALVRAGEVTAGELVRVAVGRIERLNPVLNAVVTTVFDRPAGPLTGPFAGVPFLLKDLAAEDAGVRFTEGSRFLSGNVSTEDQELVVRLKAAGLVILGKTNTCEFGMTPTVEPLLFGPTRNPWDLDRTPGGSSGGSAAAVAAGLVPFAHGNDLGGSLRYPASCCGLFGFKPSRGLNPLGPEYGDVVSGSAVEHAVTRSVRDSAALLDATAGPAPGDPYPSWPVPPGGFLAAAGRDPRPLRIAYSLRTAEGQAVDPACATALLETVALCERLGHTVVEADLPIDERTSHAIGRMYAAAVTWIVDYWVRRIGRVPGPDDLEPFTRALWEQGRTVTGGEYLMAVMDLQAFSRRVAGFFTGHDVLLNPTLAQPPVPLGQIVSTADDPWRAARAAHDFVAYAGVVANVTGAPAMSVPLHWTDGGLPVGVHALGRPGADARLFQFAGQLERARPWADRWPAIALEVA